MNTKHIARFGITQLRVLKPVTIVAGLKTCAVLERKSGPKPQKNFCPGGKGKTSSGSGKGGTEITAMKLIRAEHSGKCRLGFLPEEWFLFLHSKTGVSGPYILIIGLANYVASKEIFVMEHEYYSGLSVALILYVLTTRFGKQIGAALDYEVKVIEDEMQKGRDQEIADHKENIKQAELAQTRAKGQEMLMAAKKENIIFQLEAAYRERLMTVYRAVRDRLTYQLKRSRTEGRIQQKWMVNWILENVHKSITPEFQKQALSSAIKDLAQASPANK